MRQIDDKSSAICSCNTSVATHFELYEDDLYDSKKELLDADAFVEGYQTVWPLINKTKPSWGE